MNKYDIDRHKRRKDPLTNRAKTRPVRLIARNALRASSPTSNFRSFRR